MALSDTQSVVIMGNLVKDPEIRYVGEKNTPLCSATVASNNNHRDEPERLFLPILTLNSTAELLSKRGHKGKKVLVTGRLVTRNRAEGSSYIEMVVNDLKFISTKPEDQLEVES